MKTNFMLFFLNAALVIQICIEVEAATDSITFQGSKILSHEQSISLQDLISFPATTSYTLVYQASTDGYNINDLQTKCEGIANTLVIIKTSTSYIFGAFTTQNWQSNYWQYDKNAFLFSFINQFKRPVKMKVIQPENAIWGDSLQLNIGHEVVINDGFNSNLNYGWSGPGNSYELPSFVNNVGYSLISTSSSGFYASEIEVYQVDACWNSPCLNGGICNATLNSNTYECNCTNEYFGNDCQSRIFDSIIFQNSTILTQEQSVSLQKLLNFSSNINFSLIYQASRDGFGLSDFHSKCDGILNTLMIIKTTDSYVFGGFTTKDWSQVSGFQADSNAFTFSFINPLKESFKMDIINPYYAIYQGPDLLNNINDNNFIGFGVNDILLSDNSNLYPSYAWQVNTSSFQLPNSLDNISSLLVGGKTIFDTLEIEVYLIDPCWSGPCLNGGACVANEDNFECNCLTSYFGLVCQSKVLNSTILKNSTIFTQEQSQLLKNLTNFPSETVYTLIYQATKNGFGMSDFHSKCDGIMNTLMIIKTTESYVFGGFTTQDWSKLGSYQSDSNAFLFSLINPFNQPVKMNLVLPDFAISSGESSITFGYEIVLNDFSNQNVNYAWIGSLDSYLLPGFVNQTGSYLVGGNTNFFSLEIEVYSLNLNPCSFQPCLNGAQCTAVKSAFSCTCVNGYSGVNCDKLNLNSKIFQNSTILTQEQSVSLQKLLNFSSNINFSLIYQASRDGFGLSDFHSKCDGILNTLMIIKTTDSYVFGGFTTKDWSQVSGFQADSNAFTFSFINPFGQSVKMNVVQPEVALYSGQDYINRFYNGILGFGYDFLLNDYSNRYKNYAWPTFKSFFQIPEFVNGQVNKLINGASGFLASEIEVYAVDIDPCLSSNCLNGGICQPTSFSYTCICVGLYFGLSCQSQILDSNVFTNSTILSKENSLDLTNLIEFPSNTNFTLIYQGSRDGFGLKDFHTKCDGISNTLVVIQTRDSFILGGFTTIDWSVSNNTNDYRYDNKAFLFSLKNPLNEPFKMKVNKPDSAIHMGSDHINSIFNQILGFGQSDLLLNDYSDINLNYAWKNVLSFSLPGTLAGNGSLLMPGNFFLASQVEVFVVDACWSSPCFNGGLCSTVNFKYVCNCTNNFTGDNCNRKVFDSIIFQNSTILTQEQSVSLQKLLNFSSNINFSLIYQASRDGFGLSDFHSKCDGILNTLMIIKTTDSYVFGGFTTQDWTNLNSYQNDYEAFLFSFNNPYNETFKMKIIDPQYAIYQGPDLAKYEYNDFIGFGQNDIRLNDDSNLRSSYAWTSSVQTFELPDVVNFNGSLLIGDSGQTSFICSEIEVYSLFKIANVKIIQNVSQCHALVPCFVQPIFQVNDSDIDLIDNTLSLVIQAQISYSSNPAVKLIYQTQAAVIDGYAKFQNLTISNYSNSIVITYSSLPIAFNTTVQSIQVNRPVFKCVALNKSLTLLENSYFSLAFAIVDSVYNNSIPAIIWTISIIISLTYFTVITRFYRHGDNPEHSRIPPWRNNRVITNYSWQATTNMYSFEFYPPKGSLIKKKPIKTTFYSTQSLTYFSGLQINKTGMYLLSSSIFSDRKEFTAQCNSNPITIVKAITKTNYTNQTNYELKFRAKDSSVFNSDDENSLMATVYNCMASYNISVSNLKLNTSANINSRRRRRDLLSSDALQSLIIASFFSMDTSTVLTNVIITQGLNVNSKVVFISATINGINYNLTLLPLSSDGPNANAVSSGIVAGCVLGGTILILLIVLLGFLRYKQLKKIRVRNNRVNTPTLYNNRETPSLYNPRQAFNRANNENENFN